MTVEVCQPTGFHPKHPNDSKFYAMDWTGWLAAGVTISSSTWSSVSGLGLSDDSIDTMGTKTTIKIAGGDNGVRYIVQNTIETSNNQTVVAAFIIEVEARPNVKTR